MTDAEQNREIKKRLVLAFPGWKFSVTGKWNDVQLFAERVKPGAAPADQLAAALRQLYGFISVNVLDRATVSGGGFRKAVCAATIPTLSKRNPKKKSKSSEPRSTGRSIATKRGLSQPKLGKMKKAKKNPAWFAVGLSSTRNYADAFGPFSSVTEAKRFLQNRCGERGPWKMHKQFVNDVSTPYYVGDGYEITQRVPKQPLKSNPAHLGRHGLPHAEHPMLGLSKEQVRATVEHLKRLKAAKAAGRKGYLTEDPTWLVQQAINRRGGYVDDPHARGSAIPVKGKFPKKGGGDWERHAMQIAQDVNRPRLRVYESRLGEWGPELKKRLPKRFSRYGEGD